MRVFLPILCLCLGIGEFFLNPPISPVNSFPATTVTRTETRLLLNLKKRRVFVYQGQKIIASYPVAIGRPGWETPTGQFRVIQMVREPVWEHPFTGQLVPSGKKQPLRGSLDWILDRWREFYRFSRYTPRKSHRPGRLPRLRQDARSRYKSFI